jgi:hypothetical protein
LTQAATAELVESFPLEEQRREGLDALKNLEASFGYGNPVERALYIRAFVVTLNDEPLYGGIFLNAVSQMAVDYPVIRVDFFEGRAVLHLLPIHLPFLTVDPVRTESVTDEMIAAEARGDWNQFSPEFKSVWLEAASGEKADEFRTLIQNSQVREILERAGKLRGNE